jgi:hypothetical protein
MKTLPTSPTPKPSKIKTLPNTQNPKSKPKPNQMKTLRTFSRGGGGTPKRQSPTKGGHKTLDRINTSHQAAFRSILDPTFLDPTQ